MTTASEARQAEKTALEQRLRFAPLLRADGTKATTPAAQALCARMAELAESDPTKFDGMLADPKVSALFRSGALYFKPTAAT